MNLSLTRHSLLLICALSTVMPLAVAGETEHYDRIRFSAQAMTDIRTDVLVAVLSAQRQGQDPGKLANAVNQMVRGALEKCHQVRTVEVQTLGYETTPVYEKGHRTGWRVSQSLQLRSRDPAGLGKLLGELQQDLLLGGMGYQVSAALRNKTENLLISKAISRFRARAAMISRDLGHQRYRIVNLQITTGGNIASPLPLRRFQALASDQVAAPQIEAGKQSVTVTASGVIELE